MDMRNVDLNLLVVFDAMLEHASVTHTGRALKLSQPATSAALARLRALFSDPLFVKIGARMEPTPRASELAPGVRTVMDTVRREILVDTTFDPLHTHRTFTLITPDIGEIGFLPGLLARLAVDAPMANLQTLAMPADVAAEALETGRADLAIGFFPDLKKAGFVQQRLFKTHYVCLARRDHPTIGDRISLKQYLAASHAVIRPEGREHLVEEFLRKHEIKRRVLLSIPHYMSLVPILPTCDLISTVPRQIADACVKHANIKILAPPMALPSIDVHQSWHMRFNKDRANMWLRKTLNELFRG
jgi:DNA-binding transcriptional LysR family regulator